MKTLIGVLGVILLAGPVYALEFAKKDIRVAGKVIHAELAETEAQHEQGLMFRKKLGENDGMLFIFPGEEPMSFWMKNTYIPLSIGFFSEKKTLNEVIDMEPASEVEQNPRIYRARKNAMYALEMPKGWFKKNHVRTGAPLKLGEETKTKK